MSNLARLYLIATAVTAPMLAFPLLGILLAMPTLGLAALLPTLWLYVTAAGLPVWVLRRIGASRRVAYAIGVAAAAGLAIVPAMIADKHSQVLVEDLTSGDLPERQLATPVVIELTGSRAWSQVDGDPFGTAACRAVCQRLLLSDQVRSVSVRPREGSRQNPTVTYSREARDRCPAIFPDISEALPSTIRASIAGDCIIPRIGVGMSDGVVIREDDLGGSSVPSLALTDLGDVRRLTIAVRCGGRDTVVTRITHVELDEAVAPLTVGSSFSFLSTVHGVSAGKVRKRVNDYDYFGVVNRVTGLTLAPAGKTISAGADPNLLLGTWERPFSVGNDMMQTILDKPGSGRFGPELELAASYWAEEHVFRNAPREVELTFLARLLTDRRFAAFHYITPILDARRELVPRYAGILRERLKMRGSPLDQAKRRRVAVLLATESGDETDNWRSEAQEILRAELSPATSPLLRVAARAGAPEVLSLLVNALDASKPPVVEDAIRAVCAADAALALKLMPAVEKFVTDSRGYGASAIVAVAKFRGRSTAEALAVELPERQRRWMFSLIDRYTAENGAIQCPMPGSE